MGDRKWSVERATGRAAHAGKRSWLVQIAQCAVTGWQQAYEAPQLAARKVCNKARQQKHYHAVLAAVFRGVVIQFEPIGSPIRQKDHHSAGHHLKKNGALIPYRIPPF